MIPEFVVLIGIQNFEHCAGGIAAEVAGHFIYLVQQKHGIIDARRLHAGKYSARHRADICAAMPAYLRFVAHSAQRHLNKRSSGCPRNGLDNRSLSYARRADKTQYCAFVVVGKLVNRKIFDNSALDFFQAVMIAVENFFGFFKVEIFI